MLHYVYSYMHDSQLFVCASMCGCCVYVRVYSLCVGVVCVCVCMCRRVVLFCVQIITLVPRIIFFLHNSFACYTDHNNNIGPGINIQSLGRD